ncbi:MAG: asparagine synthase-related protein [Desulfobacterales bacterium]|nr:asparagine synthase-related protein [Desulfobacterales bacterium]
MIKMKEIKASQYECGKIYSTIKVRNIREAVGDGLAVNALSGGVDSSVVTALGHKALGKSLKTYFIDNGIMRENEPAKVAAAFKKLGIQVDSGGLRPKLSLPPSKGLPIPKKKEKPSPRPSIKTFSASWSSKARPNIFCRAPF